MPVTIRIAPVVVNENGNTNTGVSNLTKEQVLNTAWSAEDIVCKGAPSVP